MKLFTFSTTAGVLFALTSPIALAQDVPPVEVPAVAPLVVPPGNEVSTVVEPITPEKVVVAPGEVKTLPPIGSTAGGVYAPESPVSVTSDQSWITAGPDRGVQISPNADTPPGDYPYMVHFGEGDAYLGAVSGIITVQGSPVTPPNRDAPLSQKREFNFNGNVSVAQGQQQILNPITTVEGDPLLEGTTVSLVEGPAWIVVSNTDGILVAPPEDAPLGAVDYVVKLAFEDGSSETLTGTVEVVPVGEYIADLHPVETNKNGVLAVTFTFLTLCGLWVAAVVGWVLRGKIR